MASLRSVLLRWKMDARNWLAREAPARMDKDEGEQMVWHRKPLSIFALYVFICFLGYWEIFVPSPGKAVAAMAVAASAMTIRGEMRGKEKLAWMLLLFSFLWLELEAIDMEHRAQDERTHEENWNETRRFEDVRKKIQDSMDKNKKDFENTNKRSIKQFRHTMKGVGKVDDEELAIAREQQEMFYASHGHLLPGDAPMPEEKTTKCMRPLKEGEYLISFSSMNMMISKFPISPLRGGYFPRGAEMGLYRHIAEISKTADGVLVLSLDIRRPDGTIIAKFDEDGFRAGPGVIAVNPNKSTLLVTDWHGKQIVRVVYANKRWMKIELNFVMDDELTIDSDDFGNYCMPPNENGEAGLEIVKPK